MVNAQVPTHAHTLAHRSRRLCGPPGNEFYQVVFATMAIVNAYATKQAFIRWKNAPPEPDSDDEDDEDNLGPGGTPALTPGAQRAIEAAPAAKRKHKKSFKAPPKPAQPRRRNMASKHA